MQRPSSQRVSSPAPCRILRWSAPLVLLGACSTPEFYATPRIGRFDIDGEFALGSGGSTASNDLGALGLEEDDASFGGRFDLKWGSPHLTLALAESDHSGDGTLEVAVSQGGTTIPVGADVHSDFELATSQAILTFDLLPTRALELGIGFGLVGVDLDWTIDAEALGERVRTQEFAPVPVLALRAAGGIGPVNLSALISGLDVKYDGNDASLLDVDLQARWQFAKSELVIGALAIGYRRFDIDVEYEEDGDDALVDLELDGPYFGLVLGF